MSRDQRPRRAVMVDSGIDTLGLQQPIGGEADPASVDSAAPPVPVLLMSIIFLLACAAGACCMALLRSGRTW